MADYEDGPTVFKTLLKDWFDLFGWRAIWVKFFPQLDPGGLGSFPSTGVLWVTGIYVALFGIASGRYESALDRIENRQAGIYAQLGSEKWLEAINRIPNAQRMQRPIRPEILRPWSVACSLLLCPDMFDGENVASLIGVVESFNDSLSNVRWGESLPAKERIANLRGASLFGADLAHAQMSGVDLTGADLSGAILAGANLAMADLTNANLRGAVLSGANLYFADLEGADLKEAVLAGPIRLSDSGNGGTLVPPIDSPGLADLYRAENLTCDQLTSAKNWQSSYRDESLACAPQFPELPRDD